MVLLKISKEELEGYRDYKIQLAQDKVEENYTYTMLEKMLNPQFKLETVMDLMKGNVWIVLDVETYQVVDKEGETDMTYYINYLQQEMMKQLGKKKSGGVGPTWITPDPTDPNRNQNPGNNPYDIKFKK